MKYKIEVIIKCDNEEQAADCLETIASQLKSAGFNKAPNDIMELVDKTNKIFGFLYEVLDNNNTNIYNEPIKK